METVKIANDASPSGFTIINKSDFDPKVHTLHGEDKKPAAKPAAKKAPAKKA
jgi:hypothetical protein